MSHKDEDLIDANETPTEAPINVGASAVVDFFKKDQKPIDVEEEIRLIDAEAKADLRSPLDFKDLSEELAKELWEAQQQADFWASRLKDLKDQAKDLAGKERGDILRGSYVLSLTEKKGRTSTDWERYVTDNMTAKAVKEAQADPVYTKTGEPVISLSVKKLK